MNAQKTNTSSAVKYAILYCRVSDQSQVDRGHSIKEQEPMLRKFAEENGYVVKKVFVDKWKSATTTVWREELYNALNYIQEEKNISAFIVQDTDRMARCEEDHFGIRSHFKKYKTQLISMNQPGINDTAEWKLLDTIMAWVNSFQSRITWRKVSWVMQRMVEQGKTPGQAPFGYININNWTSEKPDRGVEIDEVNDKHVEEIFRLYTTGKYSHLELSKIMNAKWVRTNSGARFQRTTIYNILKNPYYLGKILYKGKLYNWNHKQLISDELFQKCKDMLATRNQFAVRKRNPENFQKFFLKWFLKCWTCWKNMSWDKAKQHHYYFCLTKPEEKTFHSNKWQNARIEKVEEQVEEFFKQIKLSWGIVDEVLARAKEILQETHWEVDTEKQSLTVRTAKLEGRRQNLEDKLLDGTISDEVYKRNHWKIESELLEIQARAEEVSKTRTDNTKLFESLVWLARNLPRAYWRSTPEVKRMYLGIFFDHFVMKDKMITKVVPSKVVSSLMKEELVTIKGVSKTSKVLLTQIW